MAVVFKHNEGDAVLMLRGYDGGRHGTLEARQPPTEIP
jgi:hypothetical protein